MTMKRHVWVVAYDISDDKDRARLSDFLALHGVRVQSSLFEIRATQTEAKKIFEKATCYISSLDSLRIYPLPPDRYEDCLISGLGPKVEAEEFILV